MARRRDIELFWAADPFETTALLTCKACGAHIDTRQAGVHHAKRHVANGEAYAVPGRASWILEMRYAVIPEERRKRSGRATSEETNNG